MGDRIDLLDTLEIVNQCVEAGMPAMIARALIDAQTPDQVRAMLAAQSPASPKAKTANAPTMVLLNEAVEARFKAQRAEHQT